MPITISKPPLTQLKKKWQLFINGAFEEGVESRTLYNPGNGQALCEVGDAATRQVENAIAAARKAFDDGQWRNTTALERAKLLFEVANVLDARCEEFALAETLNSGKPLREARFDVADSANCFRYYAGLITKPLGQVVDVPAPSVTHIVREPIGVCGQIIPWNYPLLMAAWKLAPALAAGNACVLKPSEYTPVTALMLAEVFNELGLPPGNVNVVTGDGRAGKLLAESNLVDKIAFTGSGTTGRLVAAAALGNLKKVTLELGGKSPMIVFNDFDVDVAVDYAMFAIFCHAGQVCSAGSRFIIHESLYGSFLEKFVQRSRKIRVGPGWEVESEMGPLINEPQRKKVLDYIQIGQREGATLMLGGDCPAGDAFDNGYYVNPTIFADVNPAMRIVCEEIFGPVAVVEKFKTENEAIELANSTRYGLAGAVFTNEAARAYRVANAIKAGVIWLNGFHACPNEAPFGGYKESGWGRECGTFGLDAYTEIKQINLNLAPEATGWFAQ